MTPFLSTQPMGKSSGSVVCDTTEAAGVAAVLQHERRPFAFGPIVDGDALIAGIRHQCVSPVIYWT
jgi:hypothetical protein